MARPDGAVPAHDDDSPRSGVSHDPLPRPVPSAPPPPPPPAGPPSPRRPPPILEATPRPHPPPSPADGSQSAAPPAEPPPITVSAESSSAVAAPSAPSDLFNGDSQPSDTGGMSGHHIHGVSGPHHGQPMAYPAPSTGYSSSGPLPTSQYASYPPMTSTTQPAEAYRSTSVGSAPVSLPSMRTIDPMPQQAGGLPSPHQAMPMSMSMPPTSVAGGGMPFYPHHQPSVSPSYGFPPEAMARYALPHDPRLLANRGPKKEIKRRTKTGCLTCRKRRIKCDETHPTCKNCHKSKRDCLGYDPIFRQSPGSQSTGLQPVPGSQPTTPTTPTTLPASAPASSAAVPRPPNSYGSQPPTLPNTYSHPTTAPGPSTAPGSIAGTGYDLSQLAAAGSPPIKSEAGYEYFPSAPTAAGFSAPVKAEPGYNHPPSTSYDPTFRTLPSTSVPNASSQPAADHGSHLRARKMRIDEILDLLGPPPAAQQISHTEETYWEITKVYHEVYAPGFGAFFETKWYYLMEKGKISFPKDTALIEHMATFLKILESVQAHDHSQMVYSGALETRIVWELARMAAQSPERTNNSGRLPPEGDATEARNRLRVFEALLCGDQLASNPLAPPAQDGDHHRVRQFDFWYSLGEFVRARDQPTSQSAATEREECLQRMRRLLDGRENRDVLYSIAVVRELAPGFDPSYGSTIPQHLDETDPKNRLAVASKFILDEAQVTGGTTNVVRRFSDIAARAFVNPGVSISRRT